ncbi:zinc-binding dehydrogenase [Kocuria sp.]|uniref:zinc-binding dehydrogenase n=1 Tax=Kocuria sp. TaxID=1871328 RepID=UPI0026DB8ECC|nr:zinc-binding dehydrogenase [Kocuria sp.]MDO4919612.1 zinc-binding dehydrogenase [Kocuria sp.]
MGHKPTYLSFAEAAALPLTAITAWETLFDHMHLSSESTGTLLVIGGAGGVGSLVIQFAKQFTNLTVIATAARPESAAWCERMGADAVVDHAEPLAPQLREHGDTDYVFSAYTIGRESDISEAMAPHGHLVLIDDPETFNIGAFKPRSITVTPEFMFTRSMFTTADMNAQGSVLEKVRGAVEAGDIVSTLTSELDGMIPEALLEAHRVVETGHVTGKIAVTF